MKKKIEKNITTVLGTALGILLGLWMMSYIDKVWGDNRPQYILLIAILWILISTFLQIIVHEAGHLVLGLLTGYKFISFRIGNLIWINDSEKVKFKRMSIIGTGGQCLMDPPEIVDGELPYKLYNMGGVIMNLLSAIISWEVSLLLKNIPIASCFFAIFALLGMLYALINGIPLKAQIITNDGSNTVSIGKSQDSKMAFYLQLKMNKLLSQGVRLKDMPEEWFSMPLDEEMKNSMVAFLGVVYCNRLMDEKRFTEASESIDHMLTIDSGMIDLYRGLLTCDRIFCELMGERNEEKLSELMTKEQKKFMDTMGKYPSVTRTEYAYSLIHNRDRIGASFALDKFEKIAKVYPYSGDIQSERELIALVER